MLGLALAAVLAFSAMAAGVASAAPYWQVKGASLGAGATKPFTAASTTEVTLKAPGLGITLSSPAGECSQSGEIEGSAAGTPGKKKSVVLSCKKVKVVGAEEICSAKSVGAEVGTITTNSLKGTLVWLNETGNAAGDLLEPTSGTNWAEIQIANIPGKNCPLNGTYKVTGQVINEILPIEEEAVTSALLHPATAITNYWNNEASRVKQTISGLKVGPAKATLAGKFSSSLNSKETVGVSPVTPPVPAPRWKADGYSLGAGQSKPFTATSTGTALWAYGPFAIELPECSEAGTIVGSAVGKPGTKNLVLTCKGAAFKGETPQKCLIHTPGQPSGTIVSNNLKSTLVSLGGSEIAERVEPQAGTVWFSMVVEGVGCPLAETYSVTGELAGKVSPVLEEGPLSRTTFTNPPTLSKYLYKGATPITFTGALDSSFTSGETIGVFFG
jgi:hypothetical protein